MGCGASNDAQQQQQPPKDEGPPPLTLAEKNAIATQGLKDAMKWALDQAIGHCSTATAWAEEELMIKVPVQDKIDNLSDKVSSIPIVGGGLADMLKKTTDPFEWSFADAGKTVSMNSKTITCFMNVINTINVEDAIALCRSGGVTACVDYVSEKGKASVKAALTSVVDEVMKEHALTNVWTKFIDAFNKAADKVPGIEPMEFNLNEYVLQCALDAVFIVMMRKEKEIRAAPGQAVSAAVQQAFGKADPSTWKRQ